MIKYHAAVRYDLYFWPSGAADDIFRLADRLAEEEADDLAPDAPSTSSHRITTRDGARQGDAPI
jgi:hypothetical protein